MRNAPIGVCMMCALTQESLGNIPIQPVKRYYVFSTEDTVVYIFEGIGDKETHFRLYSKIRTTSAGH